MSTYAPITTVMPLASMVTGAVVGASLGDQIRDNLVALRSGWWFRATRTSATQTTTAAAFTPIVFDTVVMSDTAAADASISLVSGSVSVTKTGLWMFGGHVQFSSTTTVTSVAIMGAGVLLHDQVNDTGNSKTHACSTVIREVTTSPYTVGVALYATIAATVQNTPTTAVWGVWLGGEV